MGVKLDKNGKLVMTEKANSGTTSAKTPKVTLSNTGKLQINHSAFKGDLAKGYSDGVDASFDDLNKTPVRKVKTPSTTPINISTTIPPVNQTVTPTNTAKATAIANREYAGEALGSGLVKSLLKTQKDSVTGTKAADMTALVNREPQTSAAKQKVSEASAYKPSISTNKVERWKSVMTSEEKDTLKKVNDQYGEVAAERYVTNLNLDSRIRDIYGDAQKNTASTLERNVASAKKTENAAGRNIAFAITGDLKMLDGASRGEMARGEYTYIVPENLAQFLTAEQMSTMKAYAAAGDFKTVADYYNAIRMQLTEQNAAKQFNAAEQATENSGLRTAASAFETGALNAFGGIPAAVATASGMIRDFVTGEYHPIDYNSAAFAAVRRASALQTGATENIKKNLGKQMVDEDGNPVVDIYGNPVYEDTFWTKAAGTAYSGVSSGVTNMLQMATGSKLIGLTGNALQQFTLLTMGGSAAGSAAWENLKSGQSNGAALVNAAMSGAIEYMTETVPVAKFLENIGGAKAGRTAKEMMKGWFSQAGSEAWEEVVGNIAENVWDNLYNGPNSELNQLQRQYMETEGLDEETARKKAFMDLIVYQSLEAAASAALSTAFMGATTHATVAAGYGKSGLAIKKQGSDAVQSEINLAGKLGTPNSMAVKQAEKIKKAAGVKTVNGVEVLEDVSKVSNRELGRLHHLNTIDIGNVAAAMMENDDTRDYGESVLAQLESGVPLSSVQMAGIQAAIAQREVGASTIEEQEAVTKAVTAQSKINVLDTATTAYVNAGVDLKTAQKMSETVNAIMNGETVSNNKIRDLKLDLPNTRFRTAFEAVTGISLGDTVFRGNGKFDELKAIVMSAAQRNAEQTAEQPTETPAQGAVDLQQIAEWQQENGFSDNADQLVDYETFAKFWRSGENPNASDAEIQANYKEYRDTVRTITLNGQEMNIKDLRNFLENNLPEDAARITDEEMHRLFDATAAGLAQGDVTAVDAVNNALQAIAENKAAEEAAMTEQKNLQSAAVANLNRGLAPYGYTVVMDYNLSGQENGYFDGKVIHLNGNTLTTERAMIFTLGHELTHAAPVQFSNDIISAFQTMLERGMLQGNLKSLVENMDAEIKETSDKYLAFLTEEHRNEYEEENGVGSFTLEMRDAYQKELLDNGVPGTDQSWDEYIREEYAADLMRHIFSYDTDIISKLAAENSAPIDRSLSILRKMMQFFSKKDPQQTEMLQIMQDLESKMIKGLRDGRKGLDKRTADKRHSISTMFEAINLEVETKDGNRLLVIKDGNGNRVSEVTESMVRKSRLGAVLQASLDKGRITEEKMNQQINFFVQFTNQLMKTQDIDMLFAISGSLGFQEVPVGTDIVSDAGRKSKFAGYTNNSDPQYNRTIDFTTICLKTQAVIDAMSSTMIKLDHGLTESEIVDIVYKNTHEAGEPVPCPVCYVFSRWVGLGGLFDNMANWQEMYANYSKEDIQKVIDGLQSKIQKIVGESIEDGEQYSEGKARTKLKNELTKQSRSIKAAALNAEKAEITAEKKALPNKSAIAKEGKAQGLTQEQIDERTVEIMDRKDALQRKLTQIRTNLKAANLDATDPADLNLSAEEQAELEALTADLMVLDQWSWLTQVRMQDDYKPVPHDVLFDINRGDEFANRYPASWKFRTTRGPAMGKAAAPYSPMHIGQVIKGAGLADISNIGDQSINNVLKSDSGELTADAKKDLDRSSKAMKAQNLMNGQRFQSTSDFRFEYALDYLLAFIDLQAIGGKVQLYTKVPEAVGFLASMGAEVNCSLMPKGIGYDPETKALLFSPITGMNAEDAFNLANAYDNVQTIMVGTSDEHIRLCMADDRIQFIIPYHASGASENRYKSMMETVAESVEHRDDYSAYQTDKRIDTDDPKILDARSARKKILTGNAAMLTESERDNIRRLKDNGNDILWELHKRFTGRTIDGKVEPLNQKYLEPSQRSADPVYYDENCLHISLNDNGEVISVDPVKMSGAAADMIFPFEYWDKTLTLDNADDNGKAFVDYCKLLGLRPRFSGWANGSHNKAKDFSVLPGYWKTLIDRRMYNNDGTYHEQKAIDVSNLDQRFFSREESEQGIVQPSKVNDRAKTEAIAEKSAQEIAAARGEEYNKSSRFSLAAGASEEIHNAVRDKNYGGDIRLTDSSPSIMIGHKGVKNLPMLMKASHIRENILSESEAKQLGLRVGKGINYHGLGESLFKEVIEKLDEITVAYRGTKNANDPSRRENSFLLLSTVKNEDGESIIVPVYINETGLYNRVFIKTNKIASVYGKNDLMEYINREIAKGNLVRIKKRGPASSESPAPIAVDYTGVTSAEEAADQTAMASYNPTVTQPDSVVKDEVTRHSIADTESDVDTANFGVDANADNYRYSLDDPPANVNKIATGSFFSGGGLVDVALASIANHQFAVEYNDRISAVYKDNVNVGFMGKDVRDFDPTEWVGKIEYFHASPVCKTFSPLITNAARAKREQTRDDITTAEATAKAIRVIRPKYFTLENVRGYEGTTAFKIIEDALNEVYGKNWDKAVYNSADYGAATSRDRLFVRATLNDTLPPKPTKVSTKANWYDAVKDMIDDLPAAKTVSPRMIQSLNEISHIDVNNIDKPLFVFGESYKNREYGHAFADKPLPTIFANTGASRIFMPDGRVLEATPDVLARISGLPSGYTLPKSKDIARTIIGNGVPVQLTQAVAGSLLNNDLLGKDLNDYGTKDASGNVRYSIDPPADLDADQTKNFMFNMKNNEVGTALTTLAGTKIKRYKNIAGKEVAPQVYVHKNYAAEVIPAETWETAKAIIEEQRPDFQYNCVMYDRKAGTVRFDESPDFDTAREPIPGRIITVDPSTGTITKDTSNNQIWHHKWLWVKNDYDGFDVAESWNWSKQYLSTLRYVAPSVHNFSNNKSDDETYRKKGSFAQRGIADAGIWDEQLDYFGLPHDTPVRRYSVDETGLLDDQKRTSEDTSLNQVPASMTNFKFSPTDRVLDWGGGRYDTAKVVMEHAYPGIKFEVHDPYNRTASHGDRVLREYKKDPATVLTINNVLNVIDGEAARESVVSESKKYLADGGMAYFTIYEGDGSGVGRVTKAKGEGNETTESWQNNMKAKEYLPLIQKYYKNAKVVSNFIIASDGDLNYAKIDPSVKASMKADLADVKKQNLDMKTSRYSINPEYARNIDSWDSDGRPNDENFVMGETGSVIQGLGATESDVFISGEKINTILSDHPEMTLDEIKRIPEILDDPVLILKSRNVGRNNRRNTRMVVFGSVKAEANGLPVMVVLDLMPTENGLAIDDYQKVDSAYTKDGTPVRFVSQSDVMYADKKRTIPVLRSIGFRMPMALLRDGSIGSITYESHGVNLSGENFYNVVDTQENGIDAHGRRYSISNEVWSVLNEMVEEEINRKAKPADQSMANMIEQQGFVAGQITQAKADAKALRQAEDKLNKAQTALTVAKSEAKAAAQDAMLIGKMEQGKRDAKELRDANDKLQIANAKVRSAEDALRKAEANHKAELAKTKQDAMLVGRIEQGKQMSADLRKAQDKLDAANAKVAQLKSDKAAAQQKFNQARKDATLAGQMAQGKKDAKQISKLQADIRELNAKIAKAEKDLKTAKEEADKAAKDAFLAGQMRQGRDDAAALRRSEEARAKEQQAHEAERQRRLDAKATADWMKAERKARTDLLKIANRLSKMKTTAANRSVINGLIGELDLVSVGMTQKSIQKISDLRDWYEDQKANNPNFISDPATEARIARLSKKHIKDMDISDILELTKVLQNIENQIATQQKFIDSQIKKATYEAGEQIIDDIRESPGHKYRKHDAIDWLITNELSPVRFAKRIVGYKQDSPMITLFNELADGQRNMIDYQMRASRLFDKWASDTKFTKKITGKSAERIKIAGIRNGKQVTVEITPDMRMALYLHSLNDQNVKHIKEGGVRIPNLDILANGNVRDAYKRGTVVKIAPAILRGLYNTMSEQEKEYANAVNKYFNGMSRSEINSTSEKLVGYSLAEVENYFPINTDDSFSKREFETLKKDGTIEGMGFLKERINAKNPIMLRGMTDILEQSIRQHSKYVGLAIPVRNFSKIWGVTENAFNDGEATEFYQKEGFHDDNTPYNYEAYTDSVQNALGYMWGSRATDYVEKMMTDLQTEGGKTEELDKLLGKLRSNYAAATLNYNLGVAIKQAASYPTAAAFLTATSLSKAAPELLTSLVGKGSVDLDLIAKYTPLLWYRSQGFSTQELGDVKKQNSHLPGLLDYAIHPPKILNWIQNVDIATTRALWKAAEYDVQKNNKALAVGSEAYYRAVADLYNKVIEETQPNYTTMQRPQLLRSDSSLVQSIAMFKTQPMQNFNLMYDAVGELAAAKRSKNASAVKSAWKTARSVGLSQLVQLWVFAMMTAAWNGFQLKKDKYEDKETGEVSAGSFNKRIGLDMIAGVASTLFGGAEIYNMIDSVMTGTQYYGMDAVSISAVSGVMSTIVDALKTFNSLTEDIEKGEEVDVETYVRKVWKSAKSFSKVFGVSSYNVTNTLSATAKWGSRAISRNAIIGDYNALRLFAPYTSSSFKSDAITLLTKAMNRGDDAAATAIREDLIAHGVYKNGDAVDTALLTRMKSDMKLTQTYKDMFKMLENGEYDEFKAKQIEIVDAGLTDIDTINSKMRSMLSDKQNKDNAFALPQNALSLISQRETYYKAEKEEKFGTDDLSGEQAAQYQKDWASTYNPISNSLKSLPGWSESAEMQQKMDDAANIYAKRMALISNSDGQFTEGDLSENDQWILKANDALKNYGIPVATYIDIKCRASGIKSVKDKNGDPVKIKVGYTENGKDKTSSIGSTSVDKMSIIYSIDGLTKQQQQAMAEYLGVANGARALSKTATNNKLKMFQSREGK